MAVDPNVQQKANNIRTKIYGEEVRESLASGLEAMSEDVVRTVVRQGIVEEQFQDVIDNTTGKDVISAPEIIAARNGEANLKDYLDKEKDSNTAQFAQKASLSYLESVLSAYSGGGVKDVFYSLTSLYAAHPNGAMGPMLVYDTTHTDGAHQYTWVLDEWKDIGLFNPEGVGEETITENKLAPDSVTPSRIYGAEVINVLDLSNVTLGKELLSYSSSGGIYTADNPNMAISGWKRVYPGEKYIMDKTSSAESIVAEFRTSTNSYLSHIRPGVAFQPNFVVTVPQGAKYMRNNVVIQNRSIATVMIAKGVVYPKKYYTFNSYTNDLFVLKDGSVSLEKLGTDALEKIEEGTNLKFNDNTDRLLLPPKMYFINGMELPLYKKSIVSTKNTDTFETTFINIPSKGAPQIHAFEDLWLMSDELSETFKIAMTSKEADNIEYIAEIKKQSINSGSKEGQSIDSLFIGDSLTENGTPTSVKNILSVLGATINLKGSYNNAEARSGWSYENFIGKSNVHASGSIITRSESGPTTRNQNPFLKLATTADKTNHPTWCFRNTGVDNELSYAKDTDKTGAFYLFDFAWYLSSHNISAPNVVTIALGTNDLMNSPITESIEDCSLALEIMIKQIKAADGTIKIGVVPSTAWLDNSYINNRWIGRVSDWIERCMKDVKGYQSTYSDLHIIPAWVHMSRKFIWEYSSQTELNALNSTKKSVIGDNLHYGSIGRKQYSNVMSAFLMNVI